MIFGGPRKEDTSIFTMAFGDAGDILCGLFRVYLNTSSWMLVKDEQLEGPILEQQVSVLGTRS